MLEKVLKIDKLFNLTHPNVASVPDPTAPGYPFSEQTLTPMTIEETGIDPKTGARVVTGTHKGFQWLGYWPGAITNIPIAAEDVLTGKMSGCWLVVYKEGKVERVGHVGTDIDRPEVTKQVKDAWNQFAKDHSADVIGGFNPFKEWSSFPKRKAKDWSGEPKFYGLITATKDFYTICVYPQENLPGQVRVAGIKKCKSVKLKILQAI